MNNEPLKFPLPDNSGMSRYAAVKACSRRARHITLETNRPSTACRQAVRELRAGRLSFTVILPATRGLFVVTAAPPAPPDDTDGPAAA